MRKIVRQIISVSLCSAMVIASLNFSPVKVDAATEDEYNEWLATERNLALNKTAIGGPIWREGQATQLTDGINNLWDNYGGITVEGSNTGYFDVDLGAEYSAASMDQVVVWWRTGAVQFSPVKGYKIQFSADNAVWTTVGEVTSYPEDKNVAWEDGAQMMVPVEIDKATVSGNVRYVRVFVDNPVEWGAQVAEIAVFSENPEAPVEIEQAENPAAVTVASVNDGEIDFTITAGANQDGYTYWVYLDDATAPIMQGCQAGTAYTLKGVKSGTHTIKVVSYYNGGLSTGIVSDPVTVKTIDDLVTSEKNLAYGKTWTLDSGTSTESGGSITNGVISGQDYATPTKGVAGSWFTIDLGAELDASYMESVYVWYRVLEAGCAPADNNSQEIQFSADNSDWTTVATVTAAEVAAARNAQGAPYYVVADQLDVTEVNAVRYVRIYYPGAVAYGAQLTEVAVFGTAVEATPTVVVDLPQSVTAVSPAYNTVDVTVVGAAGHNDYTYEVALNGDVKSVEAGETVTYTGIASGTYTVTARSVDADGNKSKMISTEVTVEDGFDYTRTDGSNDLFPDTNANGNNYIRYQGVSATASSGDAAAALDNNAGTRWESATSDPQEITVNLGSVMSVKEVSMNWEAANARTYTVEVSTDGEQWTTVASIVNQPEGARKDEIVLKTAVDAKYVKINGTARNLIYGYSIWELAIYGTSEAPAVTVEAPEVVGFQMNTDVAGVSKNSPSFRVMNTIPENAEVGTYGTVYALASSVADENIEVGQANVYTHVATAAGTVSYNGVSYYVLTFTNNGTNATAMKAGYVVRPYVIDNGVYKYGEAYTVSIYDIAKQLYDNRLSGSATTHDYLYNNVLNVVSIQDGKVDVVKNLFNVLGVTSKEDALYEGCGKVVYDALTDYVINGYVEGVGRTAEPTFDAIGSNIRSEAELALGMTLEAWVEANLYYGKVAAPGNTIVQ